MAQNKNSKKSEGLCQKLHNVVASRIRRPSHQPQGSISTTSDKKPLSKIVENPVRVLHQPSLNKMIPVEFEHFSAQENKALPNLTPLVQSSKEFGEREIRIVRSQNFAESASRKKEVAPPKRVEEVALGEGKPLNYVRYGRATSEKADDSMHEAKFSDYISKFKNRMTQTASNVGGGGGGGGGGISPRRDSFNDKVTNYINRAKIKIRTTTNVGVGAEKSLSLK